MLRVGKQNLCEPMPGSSLIYSIGLFLYSFCYALGKLTPKSWHGLPGILLSLSSIAVKIALIVLVLFEIITAARIVTALFLSKSGGSALSAELTLQYKKRLILMGGGAVLFLLMFSLARMAEIPLLLYFSKELPVRRRVKVCFFASALHFLVWMLALCLGLLDVYETAFSYGTFSSFGAYHPNIAAAFLFLLFLSFWYVYGRERTSLSLILCAAGLGVSFFLLGSRTVVVLFALVFAALILFSSEAGLAGSICKKAAAFLQRPRINRICHAIYTLLPIILIIISILAGFFFLRIYGENNAKYFSRRFVEWIRAFREYGLACGPRDLNALGERHFYLDNSFSWLIYTFGLLSGGAYIAVMCIANYRIFRSKDNGLIFVGFLLLLFAVMEHLPEHALFIAYAGCAVSLRTDS